MDVEAIRTEGLTKHFGAVAAVEELDLSVRQGEVFGFLGPNGAGKTTTIRLLLALLRPTAGRAWIHGVPAADIEARTGTLGTCRGRWRCGRSCPDGRSSPCWATCPAGSTRPYERS